MACFAGVLETLPAKGSIESLEEFHAKYKNLKQKQRAKKSTRVAEAQRSNSERWQMYVDIAKLVQAGVFASSLDAEKKLVAYAVNRKKIGVVLRLLERGEDTKAPVPECMMQGTKSKTLTERQMRDLVRHIDLCARSNRPLTGPEIQQCIWKFYLLNRNIIQDTTDIDWGRCH